MDKYTMMIVTRVQQKNIYLHRVSVTTLILTKLKRI